MASTSEISHLLEEADKVLGMHDDPLLVSLATALEQAQTELRERDERIAAAVDWIRKAKEEGGTAGLLTDTIWFIDLVNALENTDQPTPATEGTEG